MMCLLASLTGSFSQLKVFANLVSFPSTSKNSSGYRKQLEWGRRDESRETTFSCLPFPPGESPNAAGGSKAAFFAVHSAASPPLCVPPFSPTDRPPPGAGAGSPLFPRRSPPQALALCFSASRNCFSANVLNRKRRVATGFLHFAVISCSLAFSGMCFHACMDWQVERLAFVSH